MTLLSSLTALALLGLIAGFLWDIRRHQQRSSKAMEEGLPLLIKTLEGMVETLQSVRGALEWKQKVRPIRPPDS